MPRGVISGTLGHVGATPLTPASGLVEFSYTGSTQQWVVPAGVTSITVTVDGAAGSDQWVAGSGGKGARVVTTISVTPLSTIGVYVGGIGLVGTSGGGWNGGGHGRVWGGSGGGASDIRQGGLSLAHRVVVAGGGGGAGRVNFSASLVGGDAGEVGANGGGSGTGGSEGGTLSAGGALGGTLGIGGSAASNTYTGGGGGGFYGGGAGRSGSNDGGGGGSSMSTGTDTVIIDGYNAGHGRVIIEWG